MTNSGQIIEWLKTFNPTSYWQMNNIDTDVMHGKVDYALVKEPIRNVKRFISGNEIITEHFQLRARLDSSNNDDSVDNEAWLEALTDWVCTKNRAKSFPAITNIQEVGIASPYFLGRSEDKKALYQLTIFIKYRKEQ